MGKRGAVAGLAVVLAVALSFAYVHFGPRKYTLTRYYTALRLISNDAECFLVIQETRRVTSELKPLDRLGTVGKFFAMMTGDQTFPPSEFRVLHYAGGEWSESQFESAPGSFAALDNVLYFAMPRRQKTTSAWQWRDGQFRKLSAADTAGIQGRIESLDMDSLFPAPWRQTYLMAAGGTSKTHLVMLADETLSFKITPPERGKNPDDWYVSAAAEVSVSSTRMAEPKVLLRPPARMQEALTRDQFLAYQRQSPGPAGRPQDEVGQALFLSKYLVFLLIPLFPFLMPLVNVLLLKRRLLKSVPLHVSCPNTTPEQYSQLDRAKLQAYTEELTNRGFAVLMDYTVAPDSGVQMASFARLMANSRENCYAEINQVFPPGKKPLALDCALMTLYDHGWVLSTTGRRPLAGGYLMRLPRSPWKSMPGLPPSELLAAHKEFCGQFEMELGLRPTQVSLAAYLDNMQRKCGERRQALQRKNIIVILVEYFTFRFRSVREWRGEWAKEARRRGPNAYAAGASN